MRVDVKTKYTKICFNEDYDGAAQVLYTNVDFACTNDADSMALLFSCIFDDFVLIEVRNRLAEELCVDPNKDITMEDASIIIQGYSTDEKHLTAKLIPIVKAAELEFDKLLTFFPTGPA